MDLYIVRHAWAAQRGDPRWPDDGLRPLTKEGMQRFARVVGRLADRGVAPQLIATSPLVRCRQTADLLADGLAASPDVVEVEALAPGGDLHALVRWTAEQADTVDAIAWVGHSPDVEDFTAQLIGGEDACIRFAKGAVAAVRFDDFPGVACGELRWLLTARLLGC